MGLGLNREFSKTMQSTGKHKVRWLVGSLVESEHPVAPGDPEGCNTGDRPETTVVLGSPLPDVLVSAVAEGSIC